MTSSLWYILFQRQFYSIWIWKLLSPSDDNIITLEVLIIIKLAMLDKYVWAILVCWYHCLTRNIEINRTINNHKFAILTANLSWNLRAYQWRHNEHDNVSNHRPLDCLLDRLFRCRLKKTSKLRITGLCEGNSPVTGEFPSQRVKCFHLMTSSCSAHAIHKPARYLGLALVQEYTLQFDITLLGICGWLVREQNHFSRAYFYLLMLNITFNLRVWV